MTYQSILADIKNKKFAPVYFLHGTESYFIDLISDAVETHSLAEHEKAFNHTTLYGKDSDYLQVLDAARRFPMMAERQVVIIKEAQDMKSLKELEAYIDKPTPTTVLVICHKYKKYNLNSNFGKTVKAKALLFESKDLYDNQVPDWIADYLRNKKLKAGPAACELLGEYLGSNLSKVANELDKLALNLPAGAEVTQPLIEQHIGISKDYNVFEFQKALGLKDVLKANRIVNYFIANARKHPIPVIIGSLYNYFSKIYLYNSVAQRPEAEILAALALRSNFFLREYKAAARHFTGHKSEAVIHLLHEYDMKSKGVGYNSTGKPEGELLKEMTWRILHL